MMKRSIPFRLYLSLLLLPGLLFACTDDWAGRSSSTATVDDSNLVKTRLAFDVVAMNTSFAVTRAPKDEHGQREEGEQFTDNDKKGTDAERRIKDIWVFQFDATTGNLLITPRYYVLSDNGVVPDGEPGEEVDVLLKPGVSSKIYVVANTGASEWADVNKLLNLPTGKTALQAVKELTLPDPKCIAVGIDTGNNNTPIDNFVLPMEGEAAIPAEGGTITVPLTRMYAKVEIEIGDIPESIVPTAVNVIPIPYYCRVGTLFNPDEPEVAAKYLIEAEDWVSRAFSPGTKDNEGHYKDKMVIYLPENLQGRTEATENDAENKTTNAKENALCVELIANYVDIFTGEVKEEKRSYKFYPGCNNYNDYNIKRNFIYRVKMNIYNDRYKQPIPSSNCFVVKPGQTLSFLPYYRTEEGGGYKFTDYLDPDGTDVDKKIRDSETMTENIKIIWQTKNCIGNNKDGNRVWIDRLSAVENEADRKIHVKTQAQGNALIAAYNSNGDIIWSWHIWVTDADPANISNAIVYSTYAWNEKGINTNIRVPGYAIMPCNIGALKWKPTVDGKYDTDTYGMLYQWGRKDPFPPMKVKGKQQGYYNYSDNTQLDDVANIEVYDNEHVQIKIVGNGTTEAARQNGVFKTTRADKVGGIDKAASLKYAINHPTHFISAAVSKFSGANYNISGNYLNRGDWLLEGDQCLWGAYKRNESMKTYVYNDKGWSIWDNYGSEKTIFDPCPAGWRVPPGDLWLGFTSNGRNWSFDDNAKDKGINCVEILKNEVNAKNGYTLYMQGWKSGPTSFFPTQGSRLASGQPLLGGVCGNYHNATTDDPLDNMKTSDGSSIDRVNILHLHSDGGAKVNTFEDQLLYYVKAVGGPVRCVRDHK